MRSFSSLPGLKYGTFFGGTSTLSPVFGLRPFRGSRFRRRKLPNPRSSIFSPRCSASTMLLKTVSTMTSECFLVRSETRETSSTSSALVTSLQMLEMIAQRHLGTAGGFRVRLPVGSELCILQRADAEADLPFFRDQADDLHLIVLAGPQLQLLAALG